MSDTGWQWMHVDVQIVLVRSAGHAESRGDPQPEGKMFSLISLLVAINKRLVICAIHMHVVSIQLSFTLAPLLHSTNVLTNSEIT
jgi:hypothetical protein